MAQPYQQFSPLNALSYIQQQGEMGRERGQQNQLNQLASLSYSANTPEQRQQLLTNTAVISPQAAQQQEQSFASTDDRRNKTMVNMAKLLTSAPEQARPGLYQQMIPTLSQFGLSELPQVYDAQTAPIINQTAQSLVQAYGGGNGASGVQSTYVDDQGQRVAIMRDGSTQILGGNDAGANQQSLSIDINGTPTQVTFDRRTGRYSNASLGAPAAAAPAAPQGGYQNLGGQATYIDPSLPAEVQAQIRQSLSAGQEVPSQMVLAGSGGGVPLTGRRAEDQAAATEAAKIEAQLAAAERVAIAEANAARMKKEAELGASAESDRDVASATRVRDARETLDVLGEAIPLLDTATGSGLGSLRDSGAAFFGQATEGAAANAQLRVLATRLTAKVPRFEGPQSDKDVAEYKAAAGDLANDKLPTATRKAAGSTLLRLSRKAVQQAGQPSGSSAGGAGGRTIVRSGMSNGRRVVQYSDGTIDYGN